MQSQVAQDIAVFVKHVVEPAGLHLAVEDALYLEAMHMIPVPAHHPLDDEMHLAQAGAFLHQHAPPDGRAYALERHFDL